MPSSNKPGGYRYDLEDRAWLTAQSMGQQEYDLAVKAAVRPAVVDPRDWFKVRSQGQEGSCFPAGTKVTLPSGDLEEIQNLKIGDTVLTHSGSSELVTQTMQRDFTGDMITAFVKGWGKLTMTSDHVVLVLRDDEECWVSADELTEEDLLLVSRGPNQAAKTTVLLSDYAECDTQQIDGFICTPRSNPVKNEVKLDELTCFVLGLFVADGCVISQKKLLNRTCWSLNDTTKLEHIDTVKTWCERQGVTAFIAKKGAHAIAVRCNSTVLAAFFLEVCGQYCNHKKVPAFISQGTPAQRLAFLRGYFAGDGSVTKLDGGRVSSSGNLVQVNQIHAATASRVLAQQVSTIMVSLGMNPGRTFTKRRSHQTHASYQIYLYSRDAIELSGRELHPGLRAKSAKWSTSGQVRKIRRITRTPVVNLPVYDITVRNDHSFIAQGVAVHNCQGHSITACGEACFRVAAKKTTRFSPDVAYYLTQKEDGLLGGDNGSTIAGGLKVATKIGFCPEEFMPYTDRYNPQDLPKNVKELCEPYKVKKFKIFNGPDYFAEAVEWIGLGLGGVSYGIDWGVTLDSLGVASWRASNGGGHAQACFGYIGEPDKDGLPQFLLPVNSWGDWGPLHGWYLWTRDTFNRAMAHKWSVVGGISDMASPAPRKIDWAEDYPS